jgi:hypothetical protein
MIPSQFSIPTIVPIIASDVIPAIVSRREEGGKVALPGAL